MLPPAAVCFVLPLLIIPKAESQTGGELLNASGASREISPRFSIGTRFLGLKTPRLNMGGRDWKARLPNDPAVVPQRRRKSRTSGPAFRKLLSPQKLLLSAVAAGGRGG